MATSDSIFSTTFMLSGHQFMWKVWFLLDHPLQMPLSQWWAKVYRWQSVASVTCALLFLHCCDQQTLTLELQRRLSEFNFRYLDLTLWTCMGSGRIQRAEWSALESSARVHWPFKRNRSFLLVVYASSENSLFSCPLIFKRKHGIHRNLT